MVGDRIKYYRLQQKLSISELSHKAGISKSYLSYIERGIQENPSLQVLSRLAKTLEINMEDLMGPVPSQNKQKLSLDPEWLALVHEAIAQGVSKDDFSNYLDFVKFQQRKKPRKTLTIDVDLS